MKKQSTVNLRAYKRLIKAAAVDKQFDWMVRACEEIGAAKGIVTARNRKTGWKVQLVVQRNDED